MLNFNNDHLFTGYIKQLLASFNLPKYHVYTEEQRIFHARYLNAVNSLAKAQDKVDNLKRMLKNTASKEQREAVYTLYATALTELNKIKQTIAAGPELNVLATINRNEPEHLYRNALNGNIEIDYPTHMRYVPYIKDNRIQMYNPTIIEQEHDIGDGISTTYEIAYSKEDWKDCHADFGNDHKNTHEKFSNIYTPKGYVYNLKVPNYTKNLKITNNAYDSYTHEYLGDFLRFHRDYLNINLMPLYNCFSESPCPNIDVSITVLPDTIDEDTGETIKGYSAEFKTEDTRYKIYMVPIKLFQQYTIAIDCEDAVEMCCGLYGQYQYDDKYNVLMHDTYACYNYMQFNKPVLFDKPLLLGKYTAPFDSLELAQHEDDLKLFIKLPASNNSSITILEGNYLDYNDTILTVDGKRKTNHSVINFDGDYEHVSQQLKTPLQLLKMNTQTSYPFADRLVEYLTGNAITAADSISDNIERAKFAVSNNISMPLTVDGIWDNLMQVEFYNYINRYHNKNNINHDILGYVDKDVEKLYSYIADAVTKEVETISSTNIYGNEWED